MGHQRGFPDPRLPFYDKVAALLIRVPEKRVQFVENKLPAGEIPRPVLDKAVEGPDKIGGPHLKVGISKVHIDFNRFGHLFNRSRIFNKLLIALPKGAFCNTQTLPR